MLVKFEKLQEVDGVYAKLLLDVDAHFQDTKLGYAFKRFMAKNIKFFKDFNEEMEEIRVDHALTDDKTKALLIDKENPRGYQYSKEEFKKLRKAEKTLSEKYKDVECEVEPYIFKGDLTEYDLNEGDLESLEGFIINLNEALKEVATIEEKPTDEGAI